MFELSSKVEISVYRKISHHENTKYKKHETFFSYTISHFRDKRYFFIIVSDSHDYQNNEKISYSA